MAWQKRGTKRYYYRNERAGGRPVRRYVGAAASPAAELAATADDLRRLGREIEARELRDEQARLAAAAAPLLALCGLTDTLARAALVVAGYHRHARGEWRRRHGQGRKE